MNPRNRAVDWERDVLKRLMADPRVKVFQGERQTPSGRAIFVARPQYAERSCLECHSTPAAAPPEILKIYGSANGFGWREGDIVAARIVSVPLSPTAKMADRTFGRFVLYLLLVGLVILFGLVVVLHLTVVRPLRLLALRVEAVAEGKLDLSTLSTRGDEISLLSAALGRMQQDLTSAVGAPRDEPQTSTKSDGPAPRTDPK